MKKTIVKAMVGLGVVGILGACSTGGNTKDDIQTVDENRSALIIGLDDTFAPMGFRDSNNELVGFDVELANEVGDRIEREIKFQSIDWALKETELNAGNIDMIWNGYTITEERMEKVNFSKPYMNNSQLIIVLVESDIQTKEDLKDKTVAAQQSSSAVDAIMADSKDIADQFKNKEVVQFPSNNDVFNDLASGRSDAIVVDETLGRYYMKQNDDREYRVLEDSFGEEEYAIGFRKEDTELQEQINEALTELMDDGTYDDIYGKWFAD